MNYCIGVLGTMLAFTLAGGCSGTETGNPVKTPQLVGFESSQCKKEVANASPLRIGSTQAPLESVDYTGYTCFQWQRQGDALTLKAINLEGSCADSWEAHGNQRADQTMEFVLGVPQCKVLKCGTCLFDHTFELAGLAAGEDLPIAIGFRQCPAEDVRFEYELALPISANESGIVCRPASDSALGVHATFTSSCGKPEMPCGDASFCTGATCETGFSCAAPDSTHMPRCLHQCTSDQDCAFEQLSCQEGLCKLSASF